MEEEEDWGPGGRGGDKQTEIDAVGSEGKGYSDEWFFPPLFLQLQTTKGKT